MNKPEGFVEELSNEWSRSLHWERWGGVGGGGLFITVATVTETYSDQGEGCKYWSSHLRAACQWQQWELLSNGCKHKAFEEAGIRVKVIKIQVCPRTQPGGGGIHLCKICQKGVCWHWPAGLGDKLIQRVGSHFRLMFKIPCVGSNEQQPQGAREE